MAPLNCVSCRIDGREMTIRGLVISFSGIPATAPEGDTLDKGGRRFLQLRTAFDHRHVHQLGDGAIRGSIRTIFATGRAGASELLGPSGYGNKLGVHDRPTVLIELLGPVKLVHVLHAVQILAG